MLLGRPTSPCAGPRLCGFYVNGCNDACRCCSCGKHCEGSPTSDGYCIESGWSRTLSGDLEFVYGDGDQLEPPCRWRLKGTGRAVFFAPIRCRDVYAPGVNALSTTKSVWFPTDLSFSAVTDLQWTINDANTYAFKLWFGFVGGPGIFIDPANGDGYVFRNPADIWEVTIGADGDYTLGSRASNPWSKSLPADTYLSDVWPDWKMRFTLTYEKFYRGGGSFDCWGHLPSLFQAWDGFGTSANYWGPIWLSRAASAFPARRVIVVGVERTSEDATVFLGSGLASSYPCFAFCTYQDYAGAGQVGATMLGNERICGITTIGNPPPCQIGAVGNADGSTFLTNEAAPAGVNVTGGGTLTAGADHPCPNDSVLLDFDLSQVQMTNSSYNWSGALGGTKQVYGYQYTTGTQDTAQTLPGCAGDPGGVVWSEAVSAACSADNAGAVTLVIQYAIFKTGVSAPQSASSCPRYSIATYTGDGDCPTMTLTLQSVSDGYASVPAPPKPLDDSTWPSSLTLSAA